jgi:hypothetical protein
MVRIFVRYKRRLSRKIQPPKPVSERIAELSVNPVVKLRRHWSSPGWRLRFPVGYAKSSVEISGPATQRALLDSRRYQNVFQHVRLLAIGSPLSFPMLQKGDIVRREGDFSAPEGIFQIWDIFWPNQRENRKRLI